MAIVPHGDNAIQPAWLVRLLRSRLVFAVTTLVFLLLAAMGLISALAALAGVLMISIATAFAVNGEAAPDAARIASVPEPGAGDSVIETLLAGLPDPVVALDRAGDVVAFNARAGAIAPALRRGEPISLALRMPGLLEALRNARASGVTQRVEISERVPLDRRYEVFVAPVAPSVRPAELFLITFHDLTPLVRVEEMRADFVANASHELRTPLAALLGFIETLQGSARDDAKARERFLGIMRVQAMRMARLIDDLLSLSRIEADAHRRPSTPIDVTTIVRRVADELEALARERGVAVVLDAPPTPLVVAGDRDELARLFENLIENALKYGAVGKRVEVTLTHGNTRGADEVLVAVRDYGPGIAPEHLPRLTERFYRVDVTDSRAQGGTGLGLALVKHILNRHGGRLAVDSVQGQGATFTVHLPLASPETNPDISKG